MYAERVKSKKNKKIKLNDLLSHRDESNTLQMYSVHRGMKASKPNGDKPMLGDAMKHLGVRPHDVKGHIEDEKVIHHAGMSVGTNRYPSRTYSKNYTGEGSDSIVDEEDPNLLWDWVLETENLPSTLQSYDDQGNSHRLIEPSHSGELTLEEFRNEVKSTQNLWKRVDP